MIVDPEVLSMDNEFRDLEQIQERDDDTALRKLSLIAMGAFAVVAVVFATGVVVVQGVEREPEPDDDPLEEMLEAGEFADTKPNGAAGHAASPESAPVVREGLTFPEVLREHDNRAEVQAAMAAAAAEADHPDPVVSMDSLPATEALPSSETLPAQVAAGDPLAAPKDEVREAAPQQPIAAHAPAVRKEPATKGKYGVQVISYTRADQANRYAEVLQGRGHSAYVVSHTEPGRGTYWRVRIGPFKDATEAEAYRSRFEKDEQLKTMVVQSAE